MKDTAIPSDLRLLIGTNLRRLRQERDISQFDLAARAGVRPTFLARLEHGSVDAHVSLLDRLARCMRTEITAFFEPRAA